MQEWLKTKIAVWSVMIIIITALLMLIFNANPKMPNKDNIQKKLSEDQDAVTIVLEYLMGLDNKNVYIDKPDGTMFIGYEYEKITDAQVTEATKKLIGTDGYFTICKEGDTVYFELWRGTSDINCGFAYSANGRSTIQMEFLTEVVELEQKNWFYCVCDYEEWRTRQP